MADERKDPTLADRRKNAKWRNTHCTKPANAKKETRKYNNAPTNADDTTAKDQV